MAPKKRSTAVQRKTLATRKKDSSMGFDETKVLHSTPKKESNLKGMTFELNKEEIAKATEEFATLLQNEIDEYEKSVAMFKLTLRRDILKAPLSSFREYREKYAIEVIENSDVENVEPNPKSRRLRSSSVDRFKAPLPMTKPKARVSRSVTRSRNSAMKTPNMSHFSSMSEIAPITPKVNMNTPVSVLRHPRLGEQAISLSGSPLHVTIPADTNPSVNVPLSDGKVMTILPFNNPHTAQMPTLDKEFRDTVQNIQNYLAQMLNGHNSD